MHLGRLTILLVALAAGCSSHPMSEAKDRVADVRRSLSGVLDVSCIGPESANTFVIYLHGMDSISPSKQELQNRAILADLAKQKNIRFALPRAQMQCPTQADSMCWGWSFSSAEISAILPTILDSRKACFGTEKPFRMLGFSNGGYLLTKWYSLGLSPQLSRPDSLFASGSAIGNVPAGISDLSKNPKLTLMIGKLDQYNFDPSESLFHQFQSLNAPVQLIEFQGGHTLDEGALLKAFSE